MRTIELTKEQRNMVLRELSDVQDDFCVCVEVAEDITIQAKGYLYIDGYRENDYYNGTGAFVETSRTADVTLTAFVGEDGEECEVGSDFEIECFNFLQAA